jgi:hypothetical protein
MPAIQGARIRAVEFPDKVKKIRQTGAERSAIGRDRSASANCCFLRPARDLSKSWHSCRVQILNSGSPSTICALPRGRSQCNGVGSSSLCDSDGSTTSLSATDAWRPLRAKYHASEDIARNKSRNPRYRKSVTSFCRESDITAVESR